MKAQVLRIRPAAVHAENGRAKAIRHSGIRVGEIIGCRAWRVGPWRLRRGEDRLRSVYMTDYVWEPGKPASGDVRTHGIYSFRDGRRYQEQFGYWIDGGYLLFGRVKIWGEVVEHKRGIVLSLRESSAWTTGSLMYCRSFD